MHFQTSPNAMTKYQTVPSTTAETCVLKRSTLPGREKTVIHTVAIDRANDVIFVIL